MDLAALRQTVLDKLQVTSATDVFATEAQRDRLINEAYKELVNDVESAAPFWNVSPTTLTLTTPGSSVSREYSLAASPFSPVADDVRKIVDCSRVRDDVPYTVPIVSFAERNKWLGRPGRLSRVSQEGVYFYRTGSGVWWMGFVSTSPPTSTVYQVRYLETITELSQDTQEPVQVPDQWHHLIGYRAAVLAKVMENRDASGLIEFYVDGVRRMTADLSSLTSPSRVRAL